MKYAMAVLTCTVVLFMFAFISVLIGVPTGGFGFIVIQLVLWLAVMPKAWKWAITKFDAGGSGEQIE